MPQLLVILGPTASGKTRLAVQVAHRLGGEIISADSRQVYRGMDIGTGKDLADYVVEGEAVPYHLIDIVEAGSDYNLFDYQTDFHRALADVRSRGRVPVVCGGTGLYLEAVLKGHQFTAVPNDHALRTELDQLTDADLLARFRQTPSIYSDRADTSTRKRLIRAIEIADYLTRNNLRALPPAPQLPHFTLFGLDLPVELRRARISARLRARLANGMVEEVRRLLDRGVPAEKLVFYGLEYKFITQYLTGELDYATMTARLETAIHQFAKRQMTFFRSMERNGTAIHWLDGTQPTDTLAEQVLRLSRS